jgi:hypothetical protein
MDTTTKIETHGVVIKLARHQDSIQHQQKVVQWLIRSYSSVTSSYYKPRGFISLSPLELQHPMPVSKIGLLSDEAN